MNARAPKIAAGVIAALLGVAVCVYAATPEPLSGSISGWVSNSIGVPQMGAAVLLLNRSDHVVSRALTDETGAFLFDALRPGVYSVRVSLSSFFPALKSNILVQPGMKSLLNVNLAGVLSSIELVYSATGRNAVMSDDWKWTLRSATATRPVLRILPGIDFSDPSRRNSYSASVFTDTHGIVRISGGDEGRVSQSGNEADLGTAFALATSFLGTNSLYFSGNVGYTSVSGMPSAGFSTRYGRAAADGSSPQVSLTMRQLFLPARAGTALLTNQPEGMPALRTMSVGFTDRSQLSDNLRLEYGFSLESVTFLERLNYFSPFARLSYTQGDNGAIEFGYSSGIPPATGSPQSREPGSELQQDLTTLAVFPRVSLRDGKARVQRTENFEIAYRRTVGSRTFTMAAYKEALSNATVTMTGPAGFPSNDLLPDLLSHSSVFNIGDYSGFGYMASVSQALGEFLNAALAYGTGNALIPSGEDLTSSRSEEIRGTMRKGRRHWATARVSGKAPVTGTQFITSYRWADGSTLNAGHFYITQNFRPENGLNIFIRHPLPDVSGIPGRLEATADLRNLLEEGYVPLTSADGRRVVLMHTPRSFRGGVSFIF